MDLENKNINELRMLAIDMIENAKSGHPGIALGIAPTLYTLYSKILNVLPSDDSNILRDRFILSAGHGSSILYATLHAFGYDISIDDLKKFRKIGSITPGHPEFGLVPGVDATTGPLGQGVSMAVGMAIASRAMASTFNKPDITLFDNYTYTLVGEGCLMEGVSYEALALAGSLKLNKLIVLYDCNKITLDGDTKGVMEQNILSYMKSLNFNTFEVEDGNNVDEIYTAISLAKKSTDKPSFIKINTHIGFGSVLQDSNKVHGSLLGADNVIKLRETLGVTSTPFEMNKDVVRDFKFLSKRFNGVEKAFKERMRAYSRAYPGDFKRLTEYFSKKEYNVNDILDGLTIAKDMSGRDMGGLVLNQLADRMTNIYTLSADVYSSTKAIINSSDYFNNSNTGRNLKVGIREFAMGCIANGMALFGGIIPVSSTFFVFSDYMKASIRLSALMGLKTINAFTHDSIAVGEDGATHEPCEQLWTLRSIPNTYTFRPANLSETKASYITALNSNNPTNIILSRQSLLNIPSNVNDAMKGGYIISSENKNELNGVIIATGSEVGLALNTQIFLKSKGYNVRVVSMPSVEVFLKQSEKYRNSVIPSNIKSVFTIEAGSTSGWYRFAGKYGKCYGVDDFGMSANYMDIYSHFGLSVESLSKDMIKIIKTNKDKIIGNIE